ncbi:DUF3040 domain-containing protein [Pseudonocardia sp. RS11V-5]|uniref:DUF3040 domain-containing protein n=1 Tax=Pseudonocardia terrae TaxID=2905831 RepID=UPI001E529A85|nr:DUF3040 domain-containing protein [Pseudonocardia terrae]MCE3556174.1 DUF3040 domain-containing protein [Pseudonocardia terrae]
MFDDDTRHHLTEIEKNLIADDPDWAAQFVHRPLRARRRTFLLPMLVILASACGVIVGAGLLSGGLIAVSTAVMGTGWVWVWLRRRDTPSTPSR